MYHSAVGVQRKCPDDSGQQEPLVGVGAVWSKRQEYRQLGARRWTAGSV